MIGDLLEARREAVGVLRPHRGQRAQDDEVERALQQLDLVVFTWHPSGASHVFTGTSSEEESPERTGARAVSLLE